jgi:hypothetical protein
LTLLAIALSIFAGFLQQLTVVFEGKFGDVLLSYEKVIIFHCLCSKYAV